VDLISLYVCLSLFFCTYRDTVSDATYPHINLCIPAVAIWSTIEEYINNHDVRVLQQLTTSDPVLRQLWKLELGKQVVLSFAYWFYVLMFLVVGVI